MMKGPRKILEQSTLIPQTEAERALDDVLSSLSRARKARQAVEKQLQIQNSYQYLILEAGAEAFGLTKVFIYNLKEMSRRIQEYVRPKWKLLMLERKKVETISHQEDSQIIELRAELSRLREEMKALNHPQDSQQKETSRSMQTTDPTTLQQKILLETPTLPFNEEMLTSRKKLLVSRCESTKKIREHDITKEKDMKVVLQRVLEEKFKNVGGRSPSGQNESDTSFDSDVSDKENGKTNFKKNRAKRPSLEKKAPNVPPRPKSYAKKTNLLRVNEKT